MGGERARGHGLPLTGSDAHAGIYGLEDFMPLSWRPRMGETWGCAAR